MRRPWLLQGAGAASRLGRGDQARALWARPGACTRGCLPPGTTCPTLNDEGAPPAYPALFDLGQVLPIGWLHALRAAGRWHGVLAGRPDCLRCLSGGDLPGRRPPLAAPGHLLLKRRLDAQALKSPGPGPTARRGHTPGPGVPAHRHLTGSPGPAHRPARPSSDRGGRGRAVLGWQGAARGPGGRDRGLPGPHAERSPGGPARPWSMSRSCCNARAVWTRPRLASTPSWGASRIIRSPWATWRRSAAIQGRGQEAREVLRRVIAAHPDYLIARCNLAALLIQDGALDEARRPARRPRPEAAAAHRGDLCPLRGHGDAQSGPR